MTVIPSIQYKPDQLDIYLSESQIQQRISTMAEEINAIYANIPRLMVIVVLKGSFMFAADLVRQIKVPCHIEFVRLASYGNSTVSSGDVQPVDLSLPSMSGEHVLVVEDIIDTGLTLHFFLDYLTSLHHTASLRLAVLLDKVEARKKDIKVDFAGFTVGNQFLVGYGLDYAGYYRNIPFIGILRAGENEASETASPNGKA
ncbi:MAG TPA: hypoxanthine phosphoribosyltransferase [Coleofasciculaceae cyanobacterium]|jgi:hypoxanthine phosphoribosyltransferase